MQGPKWPLLYSHVDPVWSLYLLGQVLYLGKSSPYKGDSAQFSLVVSGYPTLMSFPRVDGLSTDTLVLGRHSLVSELKYTST